MKLARPVTFTALAVGGLAAVLVAVNGLAGGAGSPAGTLVTTQAERRTLRESIVAKGSLQYSQLGTLLAATGGRVTKLYVSVDDTIRPGEPILSINGRPSIAVPGDLPFWRELEVGATGPDVAQLEAALSAEGYDPGTIDNAFTPATSAALRAWQSHHGFPADGVFQPADAFPGPWPARVGGVSAAPGRFISPGDELLSLTSNTLEVRLELSPAQRLRVDEGQPVILEIPGLKTSAEGVLGPIHSAPAGDANRSSPFVATVLTDDPLPAVDGAPVSATVVLAEAEDAVAVPLAAIVMNGSGDTAVQVRQPGGGVRLVAVTTGVADGAFVQVTSGLGGGEPIVLEQPK